MAILDKQSVSFYLELLCTRVKVLPSYDSKLVVCLAVHLFSGVGSLLSREIPLSPSSHAKIWTNFLEMKKANAHMLCITVTYS